MGVWLVERLALGKPGKQLTTDEAPSFAQHRYSTGTSQLAFTPTAFHSKAQRDTGLWSGTALEWNCFAVLSSNGFKL